MPGKNRKEKHNIKVEDRRHWARERDEDESDSETSPPSTQPTIIDQYRRKVEEAEARLQEYIEAYKQAQKDQESYRLRLDRDINRKVELKFGELVGQLLHCLDDLDIALEHVDGVPEAKPLAKGVSIVRERFISILEGNGVQRIDPNGDPFDPNESEAVRVDQVGDAGLDGNVTETIRAGYRLGERVIRPARVAVGKLTS